MDNPETTDGGGKPVQDREALRIGPVDRAIGFVLEGHSIEHTLEAVAEINPEAKLADVRKKLDAHFVKAGKQSKQVINGWCREALREMYRRSVQVGDYAASMKAIDQLHKMVNE